MSEQSQPSDETEESYIEPCDHSDLDGDEENGEIEPFGFKELIRNQIFWTAVSGITSIIIAISAGLTLLFIFVLAPDSSRPARFSLVRSAETSAAPNINIPASDSLSLQGISSSVPFGPTGNPTPQLEKAIFSVDPVVVFTPVRNQIDATHPGLILVNVTNPSLNDTALSGKLYLRTTPGLRSRFDGFTVPQSLEFNDKGFIIFPYAVSSFSNEGSFEILLEAGEKGTAQIELTLELWPRGNPTDMRIYKFSASINILEPTAEFYNPQIPVYTVRIRANNLGEQGISGFQGLSGFTVGGQAENIEFAWSGGVDVDSGESRLVRFLRTVSFSSLGVAGILAALCIGLIIRAHRGESAEQV